MINKQNSDFENGFQKSKHIITKLKAFSFDTPKSIKCQNKGLKEHVVDGNRPIRKRQAHNQHS